MKILKNKVLATSLIAVALQLARCTNSNLGGIGGRSVGSSTGGKATGGAATAGSTTAGGSTTGGTLITAGSAGMTTGGALGNPPGTTVKKFLFDATKAETAGNADWVIDEDPQRIPTPAQDTVTASTPETYWTGAISAWGIALVKLGHTVETLRSGAAITFGDASNPQDLSSCNVFVVDEPNTRFTDAEKNGDTEFRKQRWRLVHGFRSYRI